jgi:PAS domain S-box-containing protein
MYYQRTKQSRRDRPPAETKIVYTLDLNGNFKFVNEAAERVTGYSCEEACAMNITQLVAPELAEYVRQKIVRTKDDVLGSVFEIEIITKDRRRIVLETSTQVVTRDPDQVEIEGIALLPVSVKDSTPVRARCLDEEFLFGGIR